MAVRQRKSPSTRKANKHSGVARPEARSLIPPQTRSRVTRTSSPIPDPDLRTPAQTSSHGPFDERSKKDPDKIPGGEKILNEQFAEEDEYTNKTGDPRIGTRGRR